MTRPGIVGLMLSSPEDERLFCAAIQSQGIEVRSVQSQGQGLIAAIASSVGSGKPSAVVVDVSVLESHGSSSAMLAARLAQGLPHLRVFVRMPNRTGSTRSERAWASHAGITSLLPGSSTVAWKRSLAPVVERIVSALDVQALEETALEAAVTSLVNSGAEPRAGIVKDIYAMARRLEQDGVNIVEAFDALHVEPGLVTDRRYRGKVYPECFVASEAIDFLASRFNVSRATALIAGTFLWRTGRIHHVLREASFDDGLLFFRIGGTSRATSIIDLGEIETAMRARDGVEIADRAYMGKSYPRCFVGSQAVEWLRHRYRLKLGEAEHTGQSLVDLGELHHVLDEHGFVGEGYFYRFRADEVD
ncbi:MAG TPA: hypothetical protein VGI57_15760 [Usitatibacter sp.]